MFLCYRNSMDSETQILSEGYEMVARVLPPGWWVSWGSGTDTSGRYLSLRSPDGVEVLLALEVRNRLLPGTIPQLGARTHLSATPSLLFSGWLSPRSRAALTAAGISYVDLTGNIDLRLSRPGLYIRVSGADHDPAPLPSSLASLKGAGAARAIRALADFLPPCGVRQLAAASGATAPVLSRVAALLEREGLLAREPRGGVASVAWQDMLRRWTQDYSLLRAHRAVPCLEPRGLQSLLRRLPSLPEPWAATGTLGVPPDTATVPLHLPALYVDAPERLAASLGLRVVEAGANVLLLAPADAGVYARSVRGVDGIVRCAPSQVYADLSTGPGRGSAEAEALMVWMEADERAWRRCL